MKLINRLVFACLLAVAPVAFAADLAPVAFQLGKTNFKRGDSITITEVQATSPQFAPGDRVVVKGTYVLASAENATLALFLTTFGRSPSTRTSPTQVTKAREGRGEFELSCQVNDVGALHVSFYPAGGGSSFGEIYFGTAAQMRQMR
jgi:hypothetical protein